MSEIFNYEQYEKEQKEAMDALMAEYRGYKHTMLISLPESRDMVYTAHRNNLIQIFGNPKHFLNPVTDLLKAKDGEFNYLTDYSNTFPVDKSRNKSAQLCIDGEFDWWLMLDADMIFPLDIIPSLLKTLVEGGVRWDEYKQKEVPVAPEEIDMVSGLYFLKAPPFKPVSGVISSMDSSYMYPQSTDYKGLVPVDVVGMGAIMVRGSAVRKMEYPYFAYPDYGNRVTGSEDVTFCMQAKRLGMGVYVDHRVVCGHIFPEMSYIRHWMAHEKEMFENGAPRPENLRKPKEGKFSRRTDVWPGGIKPPTENAGGSTDGEN